MTTEALPVAPTRSRQSKELREAYNTDFCQALANYVTSGNGLSFVSTGDELGRLVITLTIHDGLTLIDGLSETLRTGATGRRQKAATVHD